MTNPVKFFITLIPSILIIVGCSNLNSPTPVQDSKKENVSYGGHINDQYIPLIVVLYEHCGFTGKKRFVTTDVCDFAAGGIDFNDKVSSITVHKGPDYQNWKNANGGREPQVTLYQDGDYNGLNISFTIGKYDSLNNYSFSDKVSSLKFFNDKSTVPPISPLDVREVNKIYLVSRLYLDIGFSGYYIELLSTGIPEFDNIDNYYAVFDFNDRTSSLTVSKGPNWYEKQNSALRLWTNSSWSGGYQTYQQGSQVSVIGALNDMISSSDQIIQ